MDICVYEDGSICNVYPHDDARYSREEITTLIAESPEVYYLRDAKVLVCEKVVDCKGEFNAVATALLLLERRIPVGYVVTGPAMICEAAHLPSPQTL